MHYNCLIDQEFQKLRSSISGETVGKPTLEREFKLNTVIYPLP